MSVFKNKPYTHHCTYGASPTIISRTDWIGWRRSMPKEDLGFCGRKCEPFIKCSLSHSRQWVQWSWCLTMASRQLKQHSGTLKQCHIAGKPQFQFFWVCAYNKVNKFNEGDLVFTDACQSRIYTHCQTSLLHLAPQYSMQYWCIHGMWICRVHLSMPGLLQGLHWMQTGNSQHLCPG